ncbi:hypothetical protein [Antrihabitans stalactiti]|uniref:Uncharacterized protein n=1 Tax=Antrihabitans stalactiti TaxID=2584121 RepID=A0A848KC30_9NOCA|nr:hypothetical protein [Antrihabitans stalactiti]NMN95088.1 hypothetical protein [Antrihabitans stalactiti]
MTTTTNYSTGAISTSTDYGYIPILAVIAVVAGLVTFLLARSTERRAIKPFLLGANGNQGKSTNG